MRYIIGLAFLAFGLVFFPWDAGHALQNPPGSYQLSCKDIHVNGSTLYATCKDNESHYHNAEMRDFQRCRGEIRNSDGQLICAQDGGNGNYGNGNYGRDRDRDRDGDRDRYRYRNHDNWNNGIPPGSYSQTCQNIQVEGNTLRARCQKVNNRGWRDTSLKDFERCTSEIENNNGRLRCNK
jgi:hypothetical protein